MLLPFVNTAVDGPSDVGRRSHGTAQSSPGTVAAAAPSGTTAAAAPSASTAHVATASSMGPVVSVSSNSITSTPAALAMRPAGGAGATGARVLPSRHRVTVCACAGRHVAASAPVPVGASQHDSDAHGGSRAAAENIMRDVTMIVTMPAPTDLVRVVRLAVCV